MKDKNGKKYCIAIADEILGENAPVPLQGNFDELFPVVANMGFDAVELHIRNPDYYDINELKDLCRNNKLDISALGTGLESSKNGLSFTSTDPVIRKKTAICFKKFIDMASVFKSVVFLGLCRGTAPTFDEIDCYLDILAREIEPLLKYAKERNVKIGLEPIVFSMTNLLNTTEDCFKFIERPGLGSIEFLLDPYHMFTEDKDLFQSFKNAKDRIAHIHISDSNRKFPGAGNIDFDLIAEILNEIGYKGALSLEILPFPDGITAAKKGLEWMRKHWG